MADSFLFLESGTGGTESGTDSNPYRTLAQAVAAVNALTVGAGDRTIVKCRGGRVALAATTSLNAGTYNAGQVIFEPDDGQEHDSIAIDDTKFVLDAQAGGLYLSKPVWFRGLQVEQTSNSGMQIFNTQASSANGALLQDCFIRSALTPGNIAVFAPSAAQIDVINNIFENFGQALVNQRAAVWNVLNNAFKDSRTRAITCNASQVVAINNWFVGNTENVSAVAMGAGTDFNSTDLASMGYTDTPANDRLSQTFNFLSGYVLDAADVAAKDQGSDLSAHSTPFSTDNLGYTRSGTWDIGPNEQGAGTPTTNPGLRIRGFSDIAGTTPVADASSIGLVVKSSYNEDVELLDIADAAWVSGVMTIDSDLLGAVDDVVHATSPGLFERSYTVIDLDAVPTEYSD